MLIGGATVLLVLSVALVGNAVRALQEADKIAVTPVASSLARPPIYVAELTGIHPTQQGLVVQLILLLIYVFGSALRVRAGARRGAAGARRR